MIIKNRILGYTLFSLFWSAHIAAVTIILAIPSFWLYLKIIGDTREWWQIVLYMMVAVTGCVYAIVMRPRITIQGPQNN